MAYRSVFHKTGEVLSRPQAMLIVAVIFRHVKHNLLAAVCMLNSTSERFLLRHQCRTRAEKWLPTNTAV